MHSKTRTDTPNHRLRGLTIAVLLTAACVQSPASTDLCSSLSDALLISPGAGPDAAADTLGNINVVWQDPADGIMYAQVGPNGTVTVPATSLYKSTGDGFPHVAVDSAGDCHIIASSASFSGLIYLKVSGGKLATLNAFYMDPTISDWELDSSPAVAINPRTQLPVVVAEVQTYLDEWEGIWYPVEVPVYSSFIASVALDSGGNPVPGSIFEAWYDLETATPDYDASYPSVAVDNSGVTHVVWIYQDPDLTGPTVAYANPAWTYYVEIAEKPNVSGLEGRPIIIRGYDGNLDVVWSTTDGSVVWTQLNPEGLITVDNLTVSQPEAKASWPVLASASGQLVCSWTDGREGANSQIYARSLLDTVPECDVSQSPGSASFGAVAIDSSGNAAYVWQDERSGSAQLYFRATSEGTLSVTGQVTAADDGFPLGGATVTIGGSSTATGSDGSYSLTKLLPGTYSITASQPGYAPRTDSVTLSASTPVLTHDFALYPLPVVAAAQRAGTSLVDVNYVLRLAPGDSAQVSLAFSGKGGASFDFVPTAGALQGDTGSGITSGSHAVTWNAANTVPASSYFPNCVAQVSAVVGGGTIAGVSPSFALDLRLNATVSGRVLDGVDLHPIAGATVSLDGKQVTTAGDGSYSFAPMPVSSGDLIAVSATGYAPATVALQVPQGAVSVCVPDILLSPEHQAPEVTDVASTFEPVYLAGISMPDDFTASVDWNGSTPGIVSFYVNDGLFQTAAGPGPIYTVMIDSGAFDPSFVVGANTVKVVAQSVEGQSSDPFDVDVLDIPTPAQLFQVFTAIGSQVLPAPVQSISAQAQWPNPPLTTPMWKLPVLGTFGLKFYLNPELSFDRESLEWELAVGNAPDPEDQPGGTDDKSLTLYLGDKVISGDVTISGTGTVSPTDGFTDTTVSLGASLSDKLDLGTVGLPDLLGPGITGIAEKVPVVGKLVKTVSIEFYAEPELNGQLSWDFPSFRFDSATFGGSSPFYAEYNPKLGSLGELKVDVGTKTSLEFQLPPVPPDGIVKSIEIEAYASAEWKIWVFSFSGEFVWLSFSYPAKPGMNLAELGAGFSGWVPVRIIPPGGTPTAARPNLASGPEGFVANGSLQRAGVPNDLKSVRDALLAFRAIGQRQTFPPGQPRPQDGGRGDLAQADLTLVTNSLPDCQPTLDARGQELMLLYVGDNGSTNILQSTDIRWTRYDGTNWSAPLTIEADTRAEFNPQVKYDGSGDAMAVWERVADPNFTTADLTAMASQMEIAWSKWSRASGQWSVPQTLTTNSYLDHQPLLAGPMADGSLLLTWTRNTANLLMGTNSAGSDVLWSQWSPAAQTWTPPQALVTNLAYCLSQSLAGASNQALFVWSQDTGGTLTNTPDDQVFVCTWTNGAWSSAQQLTTGGAGNRNARAALSPGGALALVWQQGADLVMSTNLSSPPALARANSQTAGFEDFALTCGPGGNFCLLWQEMTTSGSHAHYAVYDPSAAAWGQDSLLRNDPPMESAFAPAWDDAGNLTVAYELVNMLTTNVTAAVTNGAMVTIPNVPLQGRVDLAVTKRSLIKDLALLAGDFTVQGNNYLPGDMLTLSANVRNTGDLAVSNVVVGFYDGDPNAGGVLITNVVIPGWLPAAASNLAVAQWVVPGPPTNYTLYAVVDFGTTSSEFNPTNNTQSVSVGGTDLAVSLVSYTASTNGALRVIAAVQNLGAPAATNSVLAISFDGQTNGFLATATVPALDPGRLAQVVLNLPPGTQPPGEATYRLIADATGVVPDVNRANETATFSVFLWIDSDGDGIPDWWMMKYFGHPTGLASDHSRAQDDFDGDGMTNFAEYLAGTDPTDPTSNLRMETLTWNPTAGVQVTWTSVSNHIYSLQRTGDLTVPFTNLVQHILATPPQNLLLDATGTNGAALYYRIKLE